MAAPDIAAPDIAAPDIAHVGYHRTGTNLLQNHLFPGLDAHIFRPSGSGWRFFDDPESFDEPAARDFFAAEQARNPARKPLLISSERFTGTEATDDLTVAEKLHRLNPEMRIILVLRSQTDIFRSLYHLHVKGGGSLRHDAFVERMIGVGRCRYDRMVERFQALFGRERVLVLLYEDLKRASDDFAAEVLRFLKLESAAAPPLPRGVNARVSDSALRLGRAVNGATRAELRPAAWKRSLLNAGMTVANGGEQRLPQVVGRRLGTLDWSRTEPHIRQAYADCNRRAGALIERRLGDYGYPH
ncbi:MAG: sulfotransferase [Kiloniellales bacterium]|nr:sulfotransferase [Kiloniellales bacterium]